MKAKILRITSDLILEMLKPGRHCYKSIENHLPEDAKVIRSGVNQFYPEAICLIIESEEFPDIKEGCLVEILPKPVFRNIKGD